MNYKQTILSAAKREDIISFFQNRSNSNTNSVRFLFPSKVIVELLDSHRNPVAPIIIHTPIIFSGPKEQVVKIIADFRIEFLTAGG